MLGDQGFKSVCDLLQEVLMKVSNGKLILIRIEIRIENEDAGLAWRG